MSWADAFMVLRENADRPLIACRFHLRDGTSHWGQELEILNDHVRVTRKFGTIHKGPAGHPPCRMPQEIILIDKKEIVAASFTHGANKAEQEESQRRQEAFRAKTRPAVPPEPMRDAEQIRQDSKRAAWNYHEVEKALSYRQRFHPAWITLLFTIAYSLGIWSGELVRMFLL